MTEKPDGFDSSLPVHAKPHTKKGCIALSEYVINGRRKLNGVIDIQGAKNSILPILAGTVLCQSEVILHHCPNITDVETAVRILRCLGCVVRRDGTTITVNSRNMHGYAIPDELMREMRSSVMFLGAILARTGYAEISLPGGCELGARPIDIHLNALSQMGMIVEENHGKITGRTVMPLHSANINLSFPSVGATENIILAGVLARGTTVITNCAREPEIVDLADFLNRCGAKITGAGDSIIYIEGVDTLSGTQYSVIPDRIVCATYMAATAVSGGKVLLRGVIKSHLDSVTTLIQQAGCEVEYTREGISVSSDGCLKKLRLIRTMPYPGFPTDTQAPFMAMCCFAEGTSVFVENIFDSRYRHAYELCRMGAEIDIQGKVAIVEGNREHLSGSVVEAKDLRGGASLIVAGLGAYGTTTVKGGQYIDRGYEKIEEYLGNAGADIVKI